MSISDTLKKTPLHDRHLALGARMMPFAGYDMPVQYSGIMDEHMAVREAAGLFDVSHMGEVFVQGPQAFAFVQHLVTNDVSALYDGKALYTVMCNEGGGVVDDLLVYRLNDENYMLVINASNIDKDVAWMEAHNPMGATLTNISDDVALLALQGPRSVDIAQTSLDADLSELKYYHFMRLPGSFYGSEKTILSRTGYTGELGLELYCEAHAAPAVWDALMEAGAPLGLKPVGLGARDTLRLEAGFCLYGNDLNGETTPLEAGLGWVTKLGKDGFVGRDALLQQKAAGIERRLIGLVMDVRGIPRQGYRILNPEGEAIGEVTSGSQSPILGQGIGLGYVINDPAYTSPGASIAIETRGRALAATVRKPPFHK